MSYSLATTAFVLLLGGFAAIQTLCGPIAAKGQLSSPRVGVVRYADGGVYLLYGLPGSYVVGPRVLDGTDDASFSSGGGIVARKKSLALLDSDFSPVGTYETDESTPLLGIESDLNTAIAWLPSTQRLVHWSGQAFASVSVPGLFQEGDVSFVSKHDNKTASLLLHYANGSVGEALVSLETGELLSLTTLAGVHGWSFRQGSFVISSDNQSLVVATPSNGNLKRFPLSGNDLKVQRVSSDCLHVSSVAAKRDWLLHSYGSDFDLMELPPPPSRENPSLPAPSTEAK